MFDYECYQKEQLIKELLLLENHLTTFKCSHCIDKHSLAIIALAEETIKMTKNVNLQTLLSYIIYSLTSMRERNWANMREDLTVIRKYRLKLMDSMPKSCGLKVNSKCSGNSCNLKIN